MGGKSRLQVRTDLATDLKITVDTEISVAELNRCIERSVSDLSRFLPLQMVYEESHQFTVTDESVTMPADTSTDAVVADEDLNAVDDGSAVGIDGQPDVPRPLIATITDSNLSMTGMTVTMYGTDENELAVKETLHWRRGDSKTIPGKKYFKNVYMVYVDQIDGASDGDILDIGYGAYTDVWVSLANKPIKFGSETSVTDVDATAITRNTDFYLDYRNGRIKAISGGDIVASDTVTISYTKSQIGLDLSALPDLIRVERVEYPVGNIPQNFVQWDTWGKILYVTGGGGVEEQQSMAEDKQIAVYYAAEHRPPNDFAPGTYPEFLENTIILSAGAYALFIYALKREHQVATDIASARSALTSANSAHSALSTALTNLKKYLDDNSGYDALTILNHVETDVVDLRNAIVTALNAANAYLDEVDTTDLQSAEAVWADYGTTYVTGGTDPAIKSYLVAGDALLNTVAVGGEGAEVPRAYREYAETVGLIVRAYEQKRADFLQMGTARTNAAMGFIQEAAQRISTIRSYIEQSQGYAAISSLFAREAEAKATQINAYLGQAGAYSEAAGAEMMLADRFRNEAIERRNEAWAIWRDRKQYIGDYTQSPVRQMPRYSGD